MINFLNELNIINNIIVKDYEYLLKLEFPEAAIKEEFEISKKLQSLINSLGENAKKMLEIGIVQDKLVEWGVKQFRLQYFNDQNLHQVEFDSDCAKVRHSQTCEGIFYYDSPTWQQDLLAKVKELINA